MRKLIATGLAAATFAGAVAASTSAAAEHRRYHHRPYHHHYYDRDRDNTGAVVAAGIIGLALGAAIGSSNNDRRYDGYDRRYYDRDYYDRSYYGRDYYAPRRCTVHSRYDRYTGRYVRTQRCY